MTALQANSPRHGTWRTPPPRAIFPVMNVLANLSTAALLAMKQRLTNWIVYIAFVDCVLVGIFVWIVVTKSPRSVMPLVPLLMLPAIALVPFLRRTAAIKRELDRRTTQATSA